MATFSNEEVPLLKLCPVETEKKMQKGIQDAAGVARRQHRRRFNGNDDEPQDRGDPCLDNVVSIGVQLCGLLDAIVGGLASDHDIVNVTLTQPCHANADEAGFL